jgi:hypothetical protein
MADVMISDTSCRHFTGKADQNKRCGTKLLTPSDSPAHGGWVTYGTCVNVEGKWPRPDLVQSSNYLCKAARCDHKAWR